LRYLAGTHKDTKKLKKKEKRKTNRKNRERKSGEKRDTVNTPQHQTSYRHREKGKQKHTHSLTHSLKPVSISAGSETTLQLSDLPEHSRTHYQETASSLQITKLLTPFPWTCTVGAPPGMDPTRSTNPNGAHRQPTLLSKVFVSSLLLMLGFSFCGSFRGLFLASN